MNLFESKTNQAMYEWAEGLAELVCAIIILEIKNSLKPNELDKLIKPGFHVCNYLFGEGVLECNYFRKKYELNDDLKSRMMNHQKYHGKYFKIEYLNLKIDVAYSADPQDGEFSPGFKPSLIINSRLLIDDIYETKKNGNINEVKILTKLLPVVTHEIVHYLQYILFSENSAWNRKGNRSFKGDDKYSWGAYYNKDSETKAYMLNFLTDLKLSNNVDSWKEVSFNKIVEELKIQKFFKYLIPQNQKKVMSILYNIYHNL